MLIFWHNDRSSNPGLKLGRSFKLLWQASSQLLLSPAAASLPHHSGINAASLQCCQINLPTISEAWTWETSNNWQPRHLESIELFKNNLDNLGQLEFEEAELDRKLWACGELPASTLHCEPNLWENRSNRKSLGSVNWIIKLLCNSYCDTLSFNLLPLFYKFW